MPATPARIQSAAIATGDCVSSIRHTAMWQAGYGAGKLRRAGHTPHGYGQPEDHGAKQWWEACGFGDHERERSTFMQAFLDALA